MSGKLKLVMLGGAVAAAVAGGLVVLLPDRADSCAGKSAYITSESLVASTAWQDRRSHVIYLVELHPWRGWTPHVTEVAGRVAGTLSGADVSGPRVAVSGPPRPPRAVVSIRYESHALMLVEATGDRAAVRRMLQALPNGPCSAVPKPVQEMRRMPRSPASTDVFETAAAARRRAPWIVTAGSRLERLPLMRISVTGRDALVDYGYRSSPRSWSTPGLWFEESTRRNAVPTGGRRMRIGPGRWLIDDDGGLGLVTTIGKTAVQLQAGARITPRWIRIVRRLGPVTT